MRTDFCRGICTSQVLQQRDHSERLDSWGKDAISIILKRVASVKRNTGVECGNLIAVEKDAILEFFSKDISFQKDWGEVRISYL